MRLRHRRKLTNAAWRNRNMVQQACVRLPRSGLCSERAHVPVQEGGWIKSGAACAGYWASYCSPLSLWLALAGFTGVKIWASTFFVEKDSTCGRDQIDWSLSSTPCIGLPRLPPPLVYADGWIVIWLWTVRSPLFPCRGVFTATERILKYYLWNSPATPLQDGRRRPHVM